jgi:hypothetical protein
MTENTDDATQPEHPADKLLGADWHPLILDLQARAWAKLSDSEYERLNELQRQRDENGNPVWQQWLVTPDPDDPEFELLMLRPADEWDTRCELVGRWLIKARTVPEERARLIREDHFPPEV